MKRTILLTKGKEAIVDEADYESLSRCNWYCSAYGYAVRGVVRDGKKTIAFMHRVIMDAPDGFEVDHIDGNRLNNSRSNLRIVTKLQNLRNSKARENSSSRHKGVNWLAANRKWRARIQIDGKQIPLGCYITEIEAAEAYNKAAIEYFGEFARLNEITI